MKILFTDLDGTLLNDKSEVSEYTKRVLDDFTNAGNKLVLCSGRGFDSVLSVKEQAGLNYPGTYIAAYNGCLIYDCDADENVLELRLPREFVPKLQKEARKFGIHIQTYSHEGIICEEENEEILFYRRRIHTPLIFEKEFLDALNEDPFKMLSIHLTDREYHGEFEQHIKNIFGKEINTMFSSKYYLEFFHKDGGKGNAVNFLCDLLNIPVENAYAAGDAENDISMIVTAGTGVAMLNATEEVKACADVITEHSNDSDGLAMYIESII